VRPQWAKRPEKGLKQGSQGPKNRSWPVKVSRDQHRSNFYDQFFNGLLTVMKRRKNRKHITINGLVGRKDDTNQGQPRSTNKVVASQAFEKLTPASLSKRRASDLWASSVRRPLGAWHRHPSPILRPARWL
jgi:hypothetical protein